MLNSRLNRIKDWPELADKAHYSARRVARLCKCTLRHLERYFLCTKGILPQRWLDELRMEESWKWLSSGHLVKQVAARFGYKQRASFSRAFKRFHGLSPFDVATGSTKEPLLGTKCRLKVPNVAYRYII